MVLGLTKSMDDDLASLIGKIERALATKPEHFVTQPVELRILQRLSDEELRDFARSHGWRVVRRVGGLQIEFYNDASVRSRTEEPFSR